MSVKRSVLPPKPATAKQREVKYGARESSCCFLLGASAAGWARNLDAVGWLIEVVKIIPMAGLSQIKIFLVPGSPQLPGSLLGRRTLSHPPARWPTRSRKTA